MIMLKFTVDALHNSYFHCTLWLCLVFDQIYPIVSDPKCFFVAPWYQSMISPFPEPAGNQDPQSGVRNCEA